jgi:hypothetical protein
MDYLHHLIRQDLVELNTEQEEQVPMTLMVQLETYLTLIPQYLFKYFIFCYDVTHVFQKNHLHN